MVYTSRCVVCELGLTEKLEQGSFSRTGVVRLFHFSLGAAADRAFAKKTTLRVELRTRVQPCGRESDQVKSVAASLSLIPFLSAWRIRTIAGCAL